MVAFSDIVENIKDAFTDNRRTAIAVIAILVAMTVSAVVIVILSAGKYNTPDIQQQVELPLTADQPLLIPPSPAVPEGYVYSREKNGRWTEEDAKIWFTPPTQNTIDELSNANDRIATEITGAAP